MTQLALIYFSLGGTAAIVSWRYLYHGYRYQGSSGGEYVFGMILLIFLWPTVAYVVLRNRWLRS